MPPETPWWAIARKAVGRRPSRKPNPAGAGGKGPVIFMTANDDEATRNAAVDAGCIAYLRKPFASQVLLDAIGKAVA